LADVDVALLRGQERRGKRRSGCAQDQTADKVAVRERFIHWFDFSLGAIQISDPRSTRKLNSKRNLVLLAFELSGIHSRDGQQLLKILEIAILLAVLHNCFSLIIRQAEVRLQLVG